MQRGASDCDSVWQNDYALGKGDIEMKERRTITIQTCDRCGLEVNFLHTLYGEKSMESVCEHAEEIDLCAECHSKFREFMKDGAKK